MKYYLKVAKKHAYIDLEATTEVEATLAALKISASETQKEIGYGVYWWRYVMPSDWIKDSETYLMRTDEEERFNMENTVVSKWD